jgi:PTS system nitrogen regulatory IIA component
LEILSEIAEMLSDTNLRDKLQQCREAQELHHLITNWQSVQTA